MGTIIFAGRLIDGTGGAPQENAVIMVDNERISEVQVNQSRLFPPPDYNVVDLKHHMVLPGLIDAHMHFFGVDTRNVAGMFTLPEAYRALRSVRDTYRLLERGFTTVRCLGSPVGPILERAIDEGLIPGPTIVAAGNFVGPSGGTWDHISLPSR